MIGKDICSGEHDWRYRKDVSQHVSRGRIEIFEVYYCCRCLQRRYVHVETQRPANGTNPTAAAYYDGRQQTLELT